MSFDTETGGAFYGILQLSADVVRLELGPKTTTKGGVSAANDTATSVRREILTFNSYVNPGEGGIYTEHATSVHGLNESHHTMHDMA